MLTELHKHLEETKLLPKNAKLLLAVSGGVDSVTLLHLLHNLRKYYDWKITIAHYNHGVRNDATTDAILVGQLADRYGYPYLLGKHEKIKKTEAELRKSRYEYLESMRRDIGADYIITAHHSNDRLETALFNTIRGAGREGMVALKNRRGNIIRPLLPFAKAEIIVFANLQTLRYREDSTNSDISYSRNFVRNILIPHGSMTFRNFHHNFNRRLAMLESVNRRINAGLGRLELRLGMTFDDRTVEFTKLEFTALPEEVQKAFFVYVVKRLQPTFQFSKAGIGRALKFIASTKPGSSFALSSRLHLVNSYDTVIITSDPDFATIAETEVFHSLAIQKPFRNKYFGVSLNRRANGKQLHIRKPKESLYVRYRQPGDRVHPVGMHGTKKLQDVFVDAKIPRHLRGVWPVVINHKNEIVWVPQLVVDRRLVERPLEKEFVTFEVL